MGVSRGVYIKFFFGFIGATVQWSSLLLSTCCGNYRTEEIKELFFNNYYSIYQYLVSNISSSPPQHQKKKKKEKNEKKKKKKKEKKEKKTKTK